MKTRIALTILLVLIIGISLIFVGCDFITKPDDSANSGTNDSTNDSTNSGTNDSTNDDTDTGCKHIYGEWTLFSDGFCEERIYKHVCVFCQNLEWKQGSEIDHNWIFSEKVDPTCSSMGYSENICTICGKTSKFDVLPSGSNHNYQYLITENTHTKYCTDCYTYYTNSHSFSAGNVCTECGYERIVYDNPLAGTYNITIWVSEIDGMTDLFRRQIEEFERLNPGIFINANIAGVTEADAGSQVICDVYSAPDIYCIYQDQLHRLVQANAISTPPSAIASQLVAANSVSSVKSASVEDTIYAYPLTDDNGYYMYYDKSIITNPDSLEEIIADVEAYNRANPYSQKYIRFNLENAWYSASFFFATGCTSQWTINEDGEFIGVNDNFNSEAGLIAMKGMQKLAQSPCYGSDNDTIDDQTAVVITGMWAIDSVEEAFGANLAATDLPSFTVDGETYHLGSFSGNKLMCVKPQADTKKAEVLHLLAQYLTGEECQMQRYENFGWGPSNLEAQQSEELQSNIHFAALAKQGEYAVSQGMIHGSWWYIGAALGGQAKYAYDVNDLQAALEEYERQVNAQIN